MKEAFWGRLNLATEMCFPSQGLGHKYKLKLVLRQYYRIIIGCFSFFKPK